MLQSYIWQYSAAIFRLRTKRILRATEVPRRTGRSDPHRSLAGDSVLAQYIHKNYRGWRLVLDWIFGNENSQR